VLAINNNGKATMTLWLATIMGVEDRIAHHVHRYNNVAGHVLWTKTFFHALCLRFVEKNSPLTFCKSNKGRVVEFCQLLPCNLEVLGRSKVLGSRIFQMIIVMLDMFRVWIVTFIISPWSALAPFKCCVSHKVYRLYKGQILNLLLLGLRFKV
jgi:hypothetical protein